MLSKLLLTSGRGGWTLQPPRALLQGAFGHCDTDGQRGGGPATGEGSHEPWLRLQQEHASVSGSGVSKCQAV